MAKKDSKYYKELTEKIREEIEDFEGMLASFKSIKTADGKFDIESPVVKEKAGWKKYIAFSEWCKKNGFFGMFDTHVTNENYENIESRVQSHIEFLKKYQEQNKKMQEKSEDFEKAGKGVKGAAKKALKKVKNENKKERSKEARDTFWKKGIWNKVKNVHRAIKNTNADFRTEHPIISLLTKVAITGAIGLAASSLILAGPMWPAANFVRIILAGASFIPLGVTAVNFRRDRIDDPKKIEKPFETVSIKELIFRSRKRKGKMKSFGKTSVKSRTRRPSGSGGSPAPRREGDTLGSNVVYKIKTIDDVKQLIMRVQNGNYPHTNLLVLLKQAEEVVKSEVGKAKTDEERSKLGDLLLQLNSFGEETSTIKANLDATLRKRRITDKDDIETVEQYIGYLKDEEKFRGVDEVRRCVTLAILNRFATKFPKKNAVFKKIVDFKKKKEDSEKKLSELKSKLKAARDADNFVEEERLRLKIQDVIKASSNDSGLKKMFYERYQEIISLYRNQCGYEELSKAIDEFWHTFSEDVIENYIKPMHPDFEKTQRGVKEIMMGMLLIEQKRGDAEKTGEHSK